MPLPWSIKTWCASQEPSDWSIHRENSIHFLERLNLSSVHPFCDARTAPIPYDIPGVPGQGPLLTKDHLESWTDVAVTLLAMGGPSVAAMAELWLRLFSSILAPLGIAHLLYIALQPPPPCTEEEPFNPLKNRQRRSVVAFSPGSSAGVISMMCLLTTAASAVLLTDTQYVLEYGPVYGGFLLAVSAGLSIAVCRQHRLYITLFGILCILVLTVALTCDPYSANNTPFAFGDPNDAVLIEEGLYYDVSNTRTKGIALRWSASHRTYTRETGATPWFPTGDSRTGLPFLLNSVPTLNWTRVWLPVADGEVVALDLLFPESGHNSSQPVYLILHGLNGGSQEEYVKDFAMRAIDEGSSVAVMVARGLMDLPVRGMNVFHGARWEDSHEAASHLRRALLTGQLLAGVGYSMGAVILGNMVTRTGKECALDVAVAISGGLDMRQEINFPRAQRLWQPLLIGPLRDTFVVGKWGERFRKRLGKNRMKALMRATHVSAVDNEAVVVYNGFRDLIHYYSEMSALGDVPFASVEFAGDTALPTRRIHNVSIPFCVVHALDDPLATWRTVAANHGLMHPSNLTRTGTGNLFILLTKRGGHVGWPLGWAPYYFGWKWMSDVPLTFVAAVIKAESDLTS